MDTLTPPSPETGPYDASPPSQPVPQAPGMPTGPTCNLCGARALAQWQRRLTEQELGHEVELEQQRRARVVELADPQLPPPVFGPLPGASDFVRPVYACGPHAITLDLATHVHQGTCTAPAGANLPGCDCTPEPHPAAPAEIVPAPGLPSLPDHWAVGGA